MPLSLSQLTTKIAAQAADLPSIYGNVDFTITPERFAVEPDAVTQIDPEYATRRTELLANHELVARLKAYTMLGDVVADAYAALIPTLGFKPLLAMLDDACDHGVERVADAPPELVRFIREMETVPTWLDMKLVERGARIERNGFAHRAPLVIRGGFIATFMNKYTALPMAMTGALSNKTAGRRVKETATFFTTTVMPGALERHGAGFKAAAKVRLMHSMVRYNVLRRGTRWDVKTYGIPVPQVDQMPAGLISTFLVAKKVLREGRTTFTPAERARVELARYRCFLLGLPEELLADTPQAIVDILLTRHATIRDGFDDSCRALVAATMAAELETDASRAGRFRAWLEGGFSKMFFVKSFVRGDRQRAAALGVTLGASDYLAAATAAIVVTWQTAIYGLAARIPGLRDIADRSLVRKLEKQLARYGHAEFTSDGESYRPAHA